MLVHLQSQLKRHFVVVGRRSYSSRSSGDKQTFDRFQVATGLATIVEPADADTANVHLQPLNQLEILCSNVLLLTAKRPLAKGEKLSMDLLSKHFDTTAKVPVTDAELLSHLSAEKTSLINLS